MTSLPPQPGGAELFHERRQARAVVKIPGFAYGFGLRRIRLNELGEGSETKPVCHGHGIDADHVASVPRDHRRAKNCAGAFFDMYLGKASGLAIENGPVYLGQRLRKGVKRYAIG